MQLTISSIHESGVVLAVCAWISERTAGDEFLQQTFRVCIYTLNGDTGCPKVTVKLHH